MDWKEKSSKYQSSYSDIGLFFTLKKFASKIGIKVCYQILLLYHMIDKVKPATKAIIIGALGYFISPFDLIIDVMPGGLMDDMAMIAFVVNLIASDIPAGLDKEVKEKLKKYFSDEDVNSLDV